MIKENREEMKILGIKWKQMSKGNGDYIFLKY